MGTVMGAARPAGNVLYYPPALIASFSYYYMKLPKKRQSHFFGILIWPFPAFSVFNTFNT